MENTGDLQFLKSLAEYYARDGKPEMAEKVTGALAPNEYLYTDSDEDIERKAKIKFLDLKEEGFDSLIDKDQSNLSVVLNHIIGNAINQIELSLISGVTSRYKTPEDAYGPTFLAVVKGVFWIVYSLLTDKDLQTITQGKVQFALNQMYKGEEVDEWIKLISLNYARQISQYGFVTELQPAVPLLDKLKEEFKLHDDENPTEETKVFTDEDLSSLDNEDAIYENFQVGIKLIGRSFRKKILETPMEVRRIVVGSTSSLPGGRTHKLILFQEMSAEIISLFLKLSISERTIIKNKLGIDYAGIQDDRACMHKFVVKVARAFDPEVEA